MSEKVAQFVASELLKVDSEIEAPVIDVRDHVFGATIPAWIDDPRTKPWKEIAARADAFVWVVPEYNHGLPGEFKMMLDSAYDEYNRKPVVFCTVSSGRMGGVRTYSMLLDVAFELCLVPVNAPVAFSKVEELFDEHGKIADESYEKKMKEMNNELVWFARTMKVGREKN